MYALEHDNIFGYDMKGFTRDNIMHSNPKILQNGRSNYQNFSFFKLGDISINIFPFKSQLSIVTCNIVWSLNKSHKQTWRFCPMLLNSMYMVANRKNSVCFVHPAFLYRSLNPSNKNMDVAERNAPITFNVNILMPVRNLT